MSDIDAIRAAATRLAPVVRHTPMLTSPDLDAMAGRKVLVKAEALQHTGSFKFRGGYSAVSALPEGARTRGVLAYSSGNHAQGVALAAKLHGIPAVIVMPQDAPDIKIKNTRDLGAEVVFYDRKGGQRREDIGEKIQHDRQLTLISPYDNNQVIAGQGTAGLEIAAQAAEHGVTRADILVCCGGGGLSSGISLAVEAEAPGLRVRPCEPEGFDDMARSLASGMHQKNAAPSGSICDAILTETPGALTLPILANRAGPGLVVTDTECEHAMVAAFTRLKLVLEPGGAAALAAAIFRKDQIEGDAVIVVATGGNVDAPIFAKILQQSTA